MMPITSTADLKQALKSGRDRARYYRQERGKLARLGRYHQIRFYSVKIRQLDKVCEDLVQLLKQRGAI